MRKRTKYPIHARPQRANTYGDEDSSAGSSADQLIHEPKSRFRFGTRGLLLLMLFSSVLFAAIGYLLQAVRGGGRGFQLAFVLFTLVGPIVVLILVSAGGSLLRWQRRTAEHEQPDR